MNKSIGMCKRGNKMFDTTANKICYVSIPGAIGICKICKKIIYKEDLLDISKKDLLDINSKVIQSRPNEYICLSHKGVKELFGLQEGITNMKKCNDPFRRLSPNERQCPVCNDICTISDWVSGGFCGCKNCGYNVRSEKNNSE